MSERRGPGLVMIYQYLILLDHMWIDHGMYAELLSKGLPDGNTVRTIFHQSSAGRPPSGRLSVGVDDRCSTGCSRLWPPRYIHDSVIPDTRIYIYIYI